MKRIWGVGLLLLSLSAPILAAKNSQGVAFSDDVQVGTSKLPRGHYTFSWTEPSGGSEVQLTLKSEGNKAVTVPAHMIEKKHSSPGTETTEVNGVTYLQEVYTVTASFIIEGVPDSPK